MLTLGSMSGIWFRGRGEAVVGGGGVAEVDTRGERDIGQQEKRRALLMALGKC